jgi:hypothetical protein
MIDDSAIKLIRQRAQTGITTGRDRRPMERAYLDRCTHFHWRTGTIVMFTRDIGHHTGGWFKNPDFERCRHLSLSFRTLFPERDPASLANVATLGRLMRMSDTVMPLVPFQPRLADEWIKLIHGDDRRWAWEEGPFSPEGKEVGVRHYRVFCDAAWQALKPRGEVYSRDLTERGWKSYSDVGAERPSHVNAD